ncbi:MAG: hypothetical protein HYT80_02320 [Euryarchaeota archaeon]|nr:hypothetical protein [Euryarchaeota archaeon]
MLGPEPLPKGYEHLTPEMCLACKGGKALCGMPCLWLAKIDARLPQLRLTSQDVFGSSPPSVFVGRYGYPNVSVGPMLPPVKLPESKALELEDAPAWLDLRIEDVVGLRSALLRARRPLRVEAARQPPRLLELTQELALSHKPVDTEIHLAKRPNLELRARLGDVNAPMGPSLVPDRVRLAQNPTVKPLVERIHADDDVKASTAIGELYRGGIPTYRIEKLLSVGVLGQRNDRKLVPTRWSITATDDQIGVQLIPKVKEQAELDAVHYHEGVSHGNRFHVFLIPRPWSFDMVETWLKGAMWSLETSPFIGDHEDLHGRRRYASNVTGAYYAARLSVLEHLLLLRRQAAAFVYREITPDYWAPLGVWLIREAVKRALASPAHVFPDMSSALAFGRGRTLRHGWNRASWLVGTAMKQRRISEFA